MTNASLYGLHFGCGRGGISALTDGVLSIGHCRNTAAMIEDAVMSLPSRVVRFVLAGLLLLAPASPATAFDYDTHYLWTYYLALHSGYSPRQAYQIASATFSIDYDPHTGPMEASAFEAISNSPAPATENIWTRFHAFADARYSSVEEPTPGRWLEIRARFKSTPEAISALFASSDALRVAIIRGDRAMVRQLREQNSSALWTLALENGNPGPYLHFIQDVYSHWDFDSRHGHLYASHAPDYLSYDVVRSREMTRESLRALREFARSRGIAPRTVNMDRVMEVLDQLVSANPPLWKTEIRYYDELIAAIVGSDPSATGLVREISGIGSPDRAKAWRVIDQAIDEDRRLNRLPSYSRLWPNDDLPEQWLQYDYDAGGRTESATVNLTRYPVEWPEIVLGEPRLSCTPIKRAQDVVMAFTLHVPFEVRGVATLDVPNFLDPLPVLETSMPSDGAEQTPRLFRVRDGRYEISRELERSLSSLAGRTPSWRVSLAVGPGNERAVVDATLACAELQQPPAEPIAAAAVFGGSWQCPARGAITFQVNGDSVAGTVSGRPGEHWGTGQRAGGSITGIVSNRVLSLLMDSGDGTESRMTATLADDGRSFAGSWDWFRGQTLLGSGTWSCQQIVEDTQKARSPGDVAVAAGVSRITAVSWLRPPTGAGAARISFGGRTFEATYQQEADERGVPIDIYFYRTPQTPGLPPPGTEQQWSRFVRQPAAQINSTQPVIWWHAHWEYGPRGWVYIQDRDVAPPQVSR